MPTSIAFRHPLIAEFFSIVAFDYGHRLRIHKFYYMEAGGVLANAVGSTKATFSGHEDVEVEDFLLRVYGEFLTCPIIKSLLTGGGLPSKFITAMRCDESGMEGPAPCDDLRFIARYAHSNAGRISCV